MIEKGGVQVEAIDAIDAISFEHQYAQAVSKGLTAHHISIARMQYSTRWYAVMVKDERPFDTSLV